MADCKDTYLIAQASRSRQSTAHIGMAELPWVCNGPTACTFTQVQVVCSVARLHCRPRHQCPADCGHPKFHAFGPDQANEQRMRVYSVVPMYLLRRSRLVPYLFETISSSSLHLAGAISLQAAEICIRDCVMRATITNMYRYIHTYMPLLPARF